MDFDVGDRDVTEKALAEPARQQPYGSVADEGALYPEGRVRGLARGHECLDAETQAVTRRGMRPHHELIVGEEVMTLADDGSTAWEPIQAVHVYDYDGPMVHYGTQGLDMMVTPNHRVVGLAKQSKKWWESEASAWTGSATRIIPVCGTNPDNDHPVSDVEIRLAAWCLTDSSLSGRGYWVFHQRPSKVTRILDLLKAAGFPPTAVSCRQRNITQICGTKLKNAPQESCDVRVGAAQSRQITKLVPKKYELPGWLSQLSQRQVEVLVDEWVYTDGSIAASGTQMIYCSDDGLRRELILLLIGNGIRATSTEYRPGHWRINLSRRGLNRECTPDKHATHVHYVGKVWSVTMASGRFMAVRNERPFLTGSSL